MVLIAHRRAWRTWLWTTWMVGLGLKLGGLVGLFYSRAFFVRIFFVAPGWVKAIKTVTLALVR